MNIKNVRDIRKIARNKIHSYRSDEQIAVAICTIDDEGGY